jgi:hypothetical protein
MLATNSASQLQFVPGGLRVYQKRRVLAQHPFDAAQDGGGAVPDLGVTGDILPALANEVSMAA